MEFDDLGFDPNDLNDIEEKFARIKKDADTGYSVEFIMTRLAAREMVETWIEALLGSRSAIKTCMANYSYIMEEIMEALKIDEDGSSQG